MQRWIATTILLAGGAWCQAQTTALHGNQNKLGGPAANRPANCAAGQLWLATDTGSLSYCATTGNPGTWRILNTGSGGGTVSGLCSVAFSGSPVFDADGCSVFQLTLGGTPVTGATLVNAQAGQELTFMISQDATGGRTFAWPANLTNGCEVSTAAGVSTIVTAIYDGTMANATYCTTNDVATVISGPTRSEPPTPSSGLSCWFDALAGGGGTWKCKDTAGNVGAAVLTASGPTAQQFVTYIDADGVPHTGPVSASQLTEGTTGTGAVVRTTGATLETPTIASFINAPHTHNDAAGGGQIAEDALNLSNVITGDASEARHGFLPKLPGDNTKCLLGDGTYGTCGGVGGGFTMSGGGVYHPLEGVFSLLHYGTNGTVAAAAANGNFECYQWTAPVAIRLANLWTVKGGNGTASDVFAAAVYQDSSNSPGTKIANSDVTVIGDTGVSYTEVPWGATHPILPAGTYWMCYSNSNASASWYSDSDSSLASQLGYLTPPRRVACQNTVTYNGAGTTLPSTCTSPSAAFLGYLPYLVIAQ